MRRATAFLRLLQLCAGGLLPAWLHAAPVEFNLPAQSAADTLLAFSSQAKVEVLFSFDELHAVRSTAVAGRLEPEEALTHLLRDTGFTARRNGSGKFVVTRLAPPTGSVRGRFVTSHGAPVAGLHVTLAGARRSAATDKAGEFTLANVLPGTYQLVASGSGYRRFTLADVRVEADREQIIAPQTIQTEEELMQLEPYVVEGRPVRRPFGQNEPAPRIVTGNLDLPRSENDALPFTVFTRDQIARSGVVDLNEFLQRELLDSDAGTRPADQNGNMDSFTTGSTNLNLRGYGADTTIVLVNGRRLPEVPNVFSSSPNFTAAGPDVNFIPLSLVQRVEVLPVSAAALYSGNAVGGVINIVLRSEAAANTTEVATTYTNALRGFDAPQKSASLQHGESLLGGRLRLRLSANYTASLPPTEAELGYRQQWLRQTTLPDDILYRATPNIRSADGSPLFGADTAATTSVAPGADGSGGLAAFTSRQGLPSLDFFRAPGGGLATSPDSLGHPYGRRQERSAYFGSVTYDPCPWLQLGFDATYSNTKINRGYDVFRADLSLAGTSPLNPFHQDIDVSLNETAPLLGQYYSEARIEFSSAVLGLLLKLPSDWRASFDTQLAHNVTKYRGIDSVDTARWQQLVDQGVYNPLRDTQAYGPPAAFYDQVLVYYGGRGRFAKLGDYGTIDAAARLSNQSLQLPTGRSSLNLGADYRRNQLQDYTEQPLYGDGTLARTPNQWLGRTLQRYSFFGELQAPLLPQRWLPSWLHAVDADIAARYEAADTAAEANLAPAGGLKFELAGGFSARVSYAQANRFPNPYLSKLVLAPQPGGGGPADAVSITDPRRNNQQYSVQAADELNPNLRTEASATTTFGVIFQRGKIRRIRLSLDLVDTQKANELVALDAQTALDLEALYPGRVVRAPLAPGDAHGAGLVTSILTGEINVASRHSQNWNLSVDYADSGVAGGTLEAYARTVYFSRYDRQALPGSSVVDELRQPDSAVTGLLKLRTNFGAGWFNHDYGFGLDGHYFGSRLLPEAYRQLQGASQIKPYWSLDAYVQGDLGRWLPWKSSHYGLRGQLRVNNISGFAYPKYAYDPSGSGVQPYGDWRSRTYSLSLTATF